VLLVGETKPNKILVNVNCCSDSQDSDKLTSIFSGEANPARRAILKLDELLIKQHPKDSYLADIACGDVPNLHVGNLLRPNILKEHSH
jgi:hypothetical protein